MDNKIMKRIRQGSLLMMILWVNFVNAQDCNDFCENYFLSQPVDQSLLDSSAIEIAIVCRDTLTQHYLLWDGLRLKTNYLSDSQVIAKMESTVVIPDSDYSLGTNLLKILTLEINSGKMPLKYGFRIGDRIERFREMFVKLKQISPNQYQLTGKDHVMTLITENDFVKNLQIRAREDAKPCR